MDCTFCGKNVPRGTGFIFAKKTGQVYHFCSRKCEHNMLHLSRQPRKTRWTKDFAKTKASNLAIREHAKKTTDAHASAKTEKK